jgi:hypothetical protein
VINSTFITKRRKFSLVLFLALFYLAGCCGKITLRQAVMDEPREIAIRLQKAMESREYEGIVDAIEPSERTRYIKYFKLIAGYYGDWDRLADAIRGRFGKNTLMEKAIIESGRLSPFRDYLRDDSICWEKLQFAQPANDLSQLYLQGLSGHVLVRFVILDGKWFVRDFDGGACGMEYMDTLARQIICFRALMADLMKVAQSEKKTEVERRVYEILGQSGLRTSTKMSAKITPHGCQAGNNPDPLLDE